MSRTMIFLLAFFLALPAATSLAQFDASEIRALNQQDIRDQANRKLIPGDDCTVVHEGDQSACVRLELREFESAPPDAGGAGAPPSKKN